MDLFKLFFVIIYINICEITTQSAQLEYANPPIPDIILNTL